MGCLNQTMITKEQVIEFTPPEGTVDPEAPEGEAMVRWQKKPDGRYCIVEFEGEAMPGYGKENNSEGSKESEEGAVPQIENYM